MKDLQNFINENKVQTTPEFEKTFALIKSLKDWYDLGVKNAKNNDGMNSPYIKEFQEEIETFVKTICSGLEYMDDNITDEIINACGININTDDDYDKIEKELVKYILN